MKKISSKNPISFRVDGATLLEITPEGILVSDEHAKIVADRLSLNVTVTDIKVDEAIKETIAPAPVEETPAPAEDEVPAPAEETLDEPTPAEETPAEEEKPVETPKKTSKKK